MSEELPGGIPREKSERVYTTHFHCEECGNEFEVRFSDPEETFSATCHHCGCYYPELYV